LLYGNHFKSDPDAYISQEFSGGKASEVGM